MIVAPAITPFVGDIFITLCGAALLSSHALFQFPVVLHVSTRDDAVRPDIVTCNVALFPPALAKRCPLATIGFAVTYVSYLKLLPCDALFSFPVDFHIGHHADLPDIAGEALRLPAFLERDPLATFFVNAAPFASFLHLFSGEALLCIPVPLVSAIPAVLLFFPASSHGALSVSVVTVGPPALNFLHEIIERIFPFMSSFFGKFFDSVLGITVHNVLDGILTVVSSYDGGNSSGSKERFHLKL